MGDAQLLCWLTCNRFNYVSNKSLSQFGLYEQRQSSSGCKLRRGDKNEQMAGLCSFPHKFFFLVDDLKLLQIAKFDEAAMEYRNRAIDQDADLKFE